jgi:poly(3-hydroxyalkanoate) synthetase
MLLNRWVSFDEHGKYDIPSIIQKILEVTKSPSTHYIGYSMGTTCYYVACNKRPDVMASVVTFTGLAPIVNLGPRVVNIAKLVNRLQVPVCVDKLRLYN